MAAASNEPLSVGIYCDARNPRRWHRPWDRHYATKLERISLMDRLGGGAVWLTEHHLDRDGYLPQPLTFAAAIAARTSRLRIGTAVLLAPLRKAIAIAEEAAVVDVLSGGRLELGLGAGYRRHEFAAYGVERRERQAALERRVREIRQIWWEGEVSPSPLQKRLPIWIGAMGPRGARTAGRLGEGLLWLHPSLLEPYREGLVESGHPPGEARMGGLVNLLLADDPEAARARLEPHIAYHLASYERFAGDRSPRRAAPPAQASPSRRGDMLVLTPDRAAEVVRQQIGDLPVTRVFLWESVAGMPDDLADRHVELVATRLGPALAAAAP